MRTDESLRMQLLLAALAALLGGGWWLIARERPTPRVEAVAREVAKRSPPGANAPEHSLPVPSRSGPQAMEAPQREALAPPPSSAAPGPAEPLRGRVVERGTGSPLFGCTVAILDSTPAEASGLPELVRTDLDGRFRTPSSRPEGTYWFYVLPDTCRLQGRQGALAQLQSPFSRATLAGEHHHRPGARENEARLVIARGPTYRLALMVPPAVDPCACEVTLHHELDDTRNGQPLRGVLNTDDVPWIRFQERVPLDLAGLPPPWRITLASWDGRFVGSAVVHSVEGECEDVVPLQMTERGALVGVVRSHDGRPARWASLTIEPLLAPRFVDYDERVRADEGGRFELRRLPPGRARLVVEADGFAAHVEELMVTAGEPRDHDVRLAHVVLGAVTGRLDAGGQTIESVPRILLRLPDAPTGSERVARVYPNPDGNARFKFADVPPGEYELSVEAVGPWAWSPARQRVQAPAVGIELVRDEEPLAMLLIEARAAEDGSALGRFDLWVDETDGLRHTIGGAGGAIVDHVRPDPETPFALTAPGRAIARGRLADLEANGRFRIGAYELNRGFSARVRAVEDASGEPLSGARVLLDGEEVARTDARGEALVSAGAPPRSLTVELAGHALVGDDLSAGRRSLDDPGDALSFRLQPAR